jgi:membrane-associated phospholipid phosphatase
VGVPLLTLLAARTDPEPAELSTSRMSARALTFWAVLAAYLVLTLCVIFKSPVLSLDKALVDLHLKSSYPQFRHAVEDYVVLGQRGPATLLTLPFFFWVAWRKRSTSPIISLLSALLLLNVSVGLVKLAIGRVGPFYHDEVHQIFAGGDIYPSGHVSNAVVLYGLIAWLAPGFRRTIVVLAVIFSITVGLGTVYQRTHWFSDVVGGWFAGSLVLLSLPTLLPYAQRLADAVTGFVDRQYRKVQDVPPPFPVIRPVQRKLTPVSAAAFAHSWPAMVPSREALEDPTRLG